MLYDRILKALGVLGFLVLFGLTIGCVAMAGISMKNGDKVGVVIYMISVLPCGFGAGAAFVVVFLRDVTDGMVDALLAPKRWRDRPAPLVGPIEALIKQEKYLAALDRVDKLIEESPEVPLPWIIRFDLFRKYLGLPDEALRTAEKYLIRPKRERSDQNAQLVLRYAELSRELGLFDQAERQLLYELKRIGTGYTRLERKMLENMLNAVRESRNGIVAGEACWKP